MNYLEHTESEEILEQNMEFMSKNSKIGGDNKE